MGYSTVLKYNTIQQDVVMVPATDASVRDMAHPSISVAVMFKETLHLVLLHSCFDGPHDFTVSSTAYLVCVTQHSHFQWGLDHTADREQHNDILYCYHTTIYVPVQSKLLVIHFIL